MRRRQVVLGLGLVATAFLAGCRSAVMSEPGWKFAQKTNREAVREAIMKGLLKRKWRILSDKPGEIVARYYRAENIYATVRIEYSNTQMKVRPVPEQTTLINEEGKVHPKYNAWVRNIINDTTRYLQANALKTK